MIKIDAKLIWTAAAVTFVLTVISFSTGIWLGYFTTKNSFAPAFQKGFEDGFNKALEDRLKK